MSNPRNVVVHQHIGDTRYVLHEATGKQSRDRGTGFSYERVAVLLINWTADFDELETSAELEELEVLFRDRFHYATQVVHLDIQWKPQLQLHEQLASFIRDHDSPHNLLIVYYTGHGVYREDLKYLELPASFHPSHGKRSKLDASVNWNKAEDILRSSEVESDTLIILDTTYASNVILDSSVPVGQANSSRVVELLSACSLDTTTSAPGKNSFTRALIDVLTELLDEDAKTSFSTAQLNQRICLKPYRRDTPSHVWSRLSQDRHILLGALRDFESVQSQGGPNALATYDSVEHDLDHAMQPPAKGTYDANSVLESDTASDFCDNESVWSVGFTESSRSSYGDSRLSVSKKAAGKLAEVLWENLELHSLYAEASIKFDKETFARNHDRLLRNFFKEIRSEVSNERQLRVVRLLRHRAQRRRVTDLIHNLVDPTADEDALRARRTFLQQREDRDEILNRFLHSQNVGATETQKIVDLGSGELANTGESEDESEEESEEEEELIESDELNAIVRFFVESQSFEQLRIVFISWIRPEKAIQEAIQLHDLEILQSLLRTQFSRVAVGDFTWIKELDNAGFAREDIAELLFEEATDSPWIYFDTRVSRSTTPPYPNFHVNGCAHKDVGATTTRQKTLGSRGRLNIENDELIIEEIQELCGLAGVTPTTRDQRSWNSTVNFTEDNSTSEVRYGGLQEDNGVIKRIFEMAIMSLQRLSHAFYRLQSTRLLCDTFTIIVHRNIPPFLPNDEVDPVELRQVRIEMISKLLDCLEALTDQPSMTRSNAVHVQKCALAIVAHLGEHHFPSPESLTLEETLHIVALATQFAILGFLSYNQAHIGSLRPFFLDTPQKKVNLLGSRKPEDNMLQIVAELAELTCIGDMLQAPVMVFSIFRSSEEQLFSAKGRKYDILTNAGALLDTWGPGNLIAPANQQTLTCGIRLCGGIIHCVDADGHLFHWSEDAPADTLRPMLLNPYSVLRIGTSVTINERCPIDEQDCWNRSHSAFEYLGVQNDYWQYDESQFGGQAGQYVMLQHNRTRHKIPGRTLKQLILEQDAQAIMHLVNDLWGLQVSFCTGVTRRVPLRLLFADLLPVFAANFATDQYPWDDINSKYKVINTLHTENVRDWFSTLPSDVLSHLLRIMHTTLVTLQPTEIDPERSHFMVAWPYDRPPFRCFKISCRDKPSSWLQVLADSGDCATFAYITMSCLETQTIKCRGPASLWHNTTPLLETAIMRHNENPSKPLGPLEHKKTYFFKKMDDMLQVTVERRGGGTDKGEVSLYVQSSSIPAKFRQRMQMMEIARKRDSRIRERREGGEPGAEQVTILAKSDRV